jgi:hypothetical protein
MPSDSVLEETAVGDGSQNETRKAVLAHDRLDEDDPEMAGRESHRARHGGNPTESNLVER